MIKGKREINDKWKTNPFAKSWKKKLENKKVAVLKNKLEIKFSSSVVSDVKVASDGSGFSFYLSKK